jgi:hypothetical protein
MIQRVGCVSGGQAASWDTATNCKKLQSGKADGIVFGECCWYMW